MNWVYLYHTKGVIEPRGGYDMGALRYPSHEWKYTGGS
jgi:hypothetical protein